MEGWEAGGLRRWGGARSDGDRKREKEQLKGLNRELAHVSEGSLC